MHRLLFWWRYWRGHTPWDTQIVPPEVVRVASQIPVGRALDLGCGTGTSSVYLAEQGWQVTGIDFVPAAIQRAKRRAVDAHVKVDFQVGDVTHLTGIYGPFNLILDVGCFHGLSPIQRQAYVQTIARLAAPQALMALYAFYPRYQHGRSMGVTAAELSQLFDGVMHITQVEDGIDKYSASNSESAWYYLRTK